MYRRRPSGLGSRRRGVIAVAVAVLLIGIFAILALTLDGALLQDNRRRTQGATDAAALAAATELFKNYPAIVASNYATTDPGGNAKAAALASASTNGYPNDGSTATVTVNIPPASGPFAGKAGYAEVLITSYQKRYFSTIWGSAVLPVGARAVARGYWGGSGDGVIILDPSAKDALDATGGGGVAVNGNANMIVNSNNVEAAAASGGGSLTAANFLITGNYTGVLNGSVQTGVLPTPDPLAYLPAPSVPPDGTMTKKNIPGGGTQYTFTPGRYTSLPNFTNGDVVTLQQASAGNGGIFYLDGTSFTSNGANITMDPNTSGGLMIYNNPSNSANSQGISIQGNSNGVVNLSALTSGPDAGILFWQNRAAAQTLSIGGSGTINLTGTFYAANAQLGISGNGGATIGSQYISRTLALGGTGKITIDYTDKGTARIREVLLVE
jgi:Putative Flp pilus-assembly TadE/G-like